MDKTESDAIIRLLSGKQWIILTQYKHEMEATSNIGEVDDRRQLLAKADQMWANVIETAERRK